MQCYSLTHSVCHDENVPAAAPWYTSPDSPDTCAWTLGEGAHVSHRLAAKQVEENCRHIGMFLEGMSLSSFAPSVCNRWRQRLRVVKGFVFLCHRAHSLLGASSFAVHSASSFTHLSASPHNLCCCYSAPRIFCWAVVAFGNVVSLSQIWNKCRSAFRHRCLVCTVQHTARELRLTHYDDYWLTAAHPLFSPRARVTVNRQEVVVVVVFCVISTSGSIWL